MAENQPFDTLRLTLMQEVLPVGLALVERVRAGGPAKVVESFTSGVSDPLRELRDEGEPAAKDVRERLDQVSPGLGNPVMPVQVAVEEPSAEAVEVLEEGNSLEQDEQQLHEVLARITQRLRALEAQLELES
ncbi:hypothetical protein WB44_11555 [Synechococcus sp. WH 8020]|uniref:hypothetical protein n=1 Tax=Synechococcus sp. (strain WH8020) TaxID=32052 RepID=UPI0006527A4A|nr:hypothetical protein [Synechococcus sp. WH 8020]AKN61622.1 hypothetical protein WB44_11555 [Synechococcus sp. WH 8020]